MSNLPQNWSWVKLGDVVENFKRGPFGSAIKKSFFVPEGYKVYEQKNAIYNSIELGNYFIDEQKFQELQGFEVGPGDFIVSCSGTIGKIYRLPPHASNGIINQALLRIRLKEKRIYEKYFLELFKSYWFQKKMLVETRGSAMLNIAGVKELKQIPIPLPPLPVQKNIVEKIEELFSQLDSGVASLKKAKEQIRLYRQSMLASAFSGKFLTPSAERVAHSEMLKAAEPKVEYSNQLPDGWKWVKTSDIIELIDNGYTPKADFMYSGKGEIPFIKVYNLTFNGKLDFSKNPIFIDKETHLKNLKRSITIPNDVLINIVGPPLGKVTIVPNTFKEWNINQAIVRFRPNKNILSKFLSYYLQNPKTIQWLESTSRATAGQYNIKVSTCREIPIPQISIKEQTQIVSEIEKRFSEADNLEKAIDDNLTKSEALRQSILKQAFEGKLV